MQIRLARHPAGFTRILPVVICALGTVSKSSNNFVRNQKWTSYFSYNPKSTLVKNWKNFKKGVGYAKPRPGLGGGDKKTKQNKKDKLAD